MRTLQSEGNDDAGQMSQTLKALGPWFHNLHLPGGVQTAPDHPLGDFPAYKWDELQEAIPQDLEGWRVLDIGCNAGFYSFELARRGARVVGVDADPHYLRQARWACDKLGLNDRVTFRHMGVYELGRAAETYDLVLFLGVFYHLRYPLLALDIVAECAETMLVFQSLSLPGEAVIEQPENLGLDDLDQMQRPGWPAMAFVRHRLEEDPTNRWVPNRACIEALLGDVGFEVDCRVGTDMYVCTSSAEGAFGAAQRSGALAAALGLESTTGGADTASSR